MKNKFFLENHGFTANDALLLKSSDYLFSSYLDRFLKEFYDFIFTFKQARLFIHSEAILNSHKGAISKWYLNLFSGEYGDEYIEMLRNISETHITIGLSSHYVNAAFGFVRRFMRKVLL